MAKKHNLAGWVEIPVTDMKRAKKFYESIFNVKLTAEHAGETDLAMFPFVPDGYGSGVGLAFNKKYYKPSKDGVMVYLTTPTGDLDKDLERVKKSGGKVVLPTTEIGEHGYICAFVDSEGNRISLHKRK